MSDFDDLVRATAGFDDTQLPPGVELFSTPAGSIPRWAEQAAQELAEAVLAHAQELQMLSLLPDGGIRCWGPSIIAKHWRAAYPNERLTELPPTNQYGRRLCGPDC